jgi:hypothetical protein
MLILKLDFLFLLFSLQNFLVFQTKNFGPKNQIWGGGPKSTPYHFGQVNFNMSNVIGVVFFTSKIKDHLIGQRI